MDNLEIDQNRLKNQDGFEIDSDRFRLKNQDSLEIFGISGKMGSGKNFVAEQILLPLLPPKPTLVMAFADHFKIEACGKHHLSYEDVFLHKTKEVRRILQLCGTEEGRNKYGEDIWVRILSTWIRNYQEKGIQRIIITDVRFPNEADWIKKHGYLIRIHAPLRTEKRALLETQDPKILQQIASHPSETGLDDYPEDRFDLLLDNDPGDDQIYNRVRDFVLTLEKVEDLVIFCDLDDTICQCNLFYQKIAEEVREEFSIPRVKWNRLANKYINNFATRYYQKDDFALSLIRAVENHYEQLGDEKQNLTQGEKDWIFKKGMSVYNFYYDFLDPSIPSTLEEINKLGKLVIYTLGDRCEQMKKILRLELQKYPVEIFPHKDVNMFQYLKTKYRAQKYIMIGDSYSRDIRPALEAAIDLAIQINKDRPLGVEVLQEIRTA